MTLHGRNGNSDSVYLTSAVRAACFKKTNSFVTTVADWSEGGSLQLKLVKKERKRKKEKKEFSLHRQSDPQ